MNFINPTIIYPIGNHAMSGCDHKDEFTGLRCNNHGLLYHNYTAKSTQRFLSFFCPSHADFYIEKYGFKIWRSSYYSFYIRAY
jgi:hypothetical protein